MGEDIALWKSGTLSPQEKNLLLLNLGFFSTAESLVANNLTLAVYKFVTNGECRQYLLRQAFEEAIHAHAFVYMCESLSLEAVSIFTMYRENPFIQEKEAFQIELTQALSQESFSTDSEENARLFLSNLIGYYVILEGIFFYGGFAMVLSFQRRNKFPGICQLYEFILRDETIHLNFGLDLIHGIREENPTLWNTNLEEKVKTWVQKAVEIESRYIEACLGEGVLGLKKESFVSYIQYLADRRLERLGMKKIYGTSNPLVWMSETLDLYKEKNFFEKTVTEYRPGSDLSW